MGNYEGIFHTFMTFYKLKNLVKLVKIIVSCSSTDSQRRILILMYLIRGEAVQRSNWSRVRRLQLAQVGQQ